MAICYILYTILILIVSSVDFQCNTYKTSKASLAIDDNKAYSYCQSAATETMTGCMVQTTTTTWLQLDGSYISGTTCVGQNGGDGGGVYSYAQCCTIPTMYNIQCNHISGSQTISASSASTTQCAYNEILTGCSVHGYGNTLDGSWIGNAYPNTLSRETLLNTSNICNAYDSTPVPDHNGHYWGVSADAVCCTTSNDTTLNCKYIISKNSGTSVGSVASVACPNGFAMTGCSGVSGTVQSQSINAWYISNGICHARNSRNGAYVIAMAICCEIITAAPTNNPTIEPTYNPTFKPTIEGIKETTDPTMEPTIQPTYDPTIVPVFEVKNRVDHSTGGSMRLESVVLIIIVPIVLVMCCGLYCVYRLRMKPSISQTITIQSETLSAPLLMQETTETNELQQNLVQMSGVANLYNKNENNDDNLSEIFDDPGIITSKERETKSTITTTGNESDDQLQNENIANDEFILRTDDEIMQSNMTPTTSLEANKRNVETIKYKLPSNNITKAHWM